jgi:hypothetical protein
MRPQKQSFKHDPSKGINGDCHRTAIAMILNMDRDDVPHFMDGVPMEAPDDHPIVLAVTHRIDAFLAGHGLAQISFALPGELKLDEAMNYIDAWCKAPVILGGTSTTGVDHSVVVYQGEIHNPNDADLIGPTSNGFWWVTAFATGENWTALRKAAEAEL